MENTQKLIVLPSNTTYQHDSHVKSYIKHIFEDVGSWTKTESRNPEKLERTIKKLTNAGYPGCPETGIALARQLGY